MDVWVKEACPYREPYLAHLNIDLSLHQRTSRCRCGPAALLQLLSSQFLVNCDQSRLGRCSGDMRRGFRHLVSPVPFGDNLRRWCVLLFSRDTPTDRFCLVAHLSFLWFDYSGLWLGFYALYYLRRRRLRTHTTRI